MHRPTRETTRNRLKHMLRSAGCRPSFHPGGTLKEPFQRRGDNWRRAWGIHLRAWCIIFRCRKRKITTIWQPQQSGCTKYRMTDIRDHKIRNVEVQQGSCSSLKSVKKQPGDDSVGGFPQIWRGLDERELCAYAALLIWACVCRSWGKAFTCSLGHREGSSKFHTWCHFKSNFSQMVW